MTETNIHQDKGREKHQDNPLEDHNSRFSVTVQLKSNKINAIHQRNSTITTTKHIIFRSRVVFKKNSYVVLIKGTQLRLRTLARYSSQNESQDTQNLQ